MREHLQPCNGEINPAEADRPDFEVLELRFFGELEEIFVSMQTETFKAMLNA